MVYQTASPAPNDDLDVSVTDIQQNFLTANTVFDIDHYPFNDSTANKGFHHTVTSPDQVTAPVTTTEPKMFGLQVTAPIGVLQFSKGPSNAVPNPITFLYGGPVSINNLATSNVLDFAGVARAYCILTAFNDTNTTLKNPASVIVVYSQGVFSSLPAAAGSLGAFASGTILQLKNNTGGTLGNVYWQLQFIRLQ